MDIVRALSTCVSQSSFSAAKSSAREPMLTRVTVGFCSNMLLRGFAQLKRCAAPKSATELGCELLFAASITANAEYHAFAQSVVRRPGPPVSTTCTDWVATMSATCETDEQAADAWRLLSEGGSMDSGLELVGSGAVPSYYASGADATIRPVILSEYATHSDSNTTRVDCARGSSGWVLAAGGVRAVFEIFRSAGQSLYACVHGETRADAVDLSLGSPEPLDSETLAEFARRAMLSSSPLLESNSRMPRVTLVYCAVDCAHYNWQRFCDGISTETIAETYAMLARNNAFGVLGDPRVSSLDRWQFMRMLLPMVHFNVRPAFQESIAGAAPRRSPFAILDVAAT